MAVPTISLVKSRADRKTFIKFPYRLYRDTPMWVPPLLVDMEHLVNVKKNAFFEHGKGAFFLARSSSGEIVGRIAGIVNGMHLKKYNDGVGFFGFYECINDSDVSKALFEAASDWLKAEGMSSIRGPVNPSMNDTAGLLISGFERQPAVMLPYNFDYYEQQLLDFGFERCTTMWSYYTNVRLVDATRLLRGADIIKRRNPHLTIRTLDMKEYETDARALLEVYNDAWSENWGHVPMTDGEFAQMTKSMKEIINPDLVNIVMDGDEPIAFSVSLPDINYALIKIRNGRLLPFGILKLFAMIKLDAIRESRMLLMGVKKKYQGKGLDMLVVADMLVRNRKIGMLGCDMSWVLDDNLKLRNFLEGIGCVKENEYALFELPIA
ncbi:MAG: hypothetical protein E2O84_08200 [Bacteroidetes bacterium]|nr:MAG: hypothetical protein E2O84_08200 [Bacteroidota bacterium]